MKITNRFLVYPEDETQEIEHDLSFDALVDMNGKPLRLPLSTDKMIVYRVFKIQRKEQRGEENVYFHLELVGARELAGMVR